MDELIVLDDDTGIRYIFRGNNTYMLVDGKEVLVKNEHGRRRKTDKSKDTSDRPRK